MIKNTIVLEVLSRGLKEGITRIGDLTKANKKLADTIKSQAVKSANEHGVALKRNAVIGSQLVSVLKNLDGQSGHFEKRVNYLRAENGEIVKQITYVQRLAAQYKRITDSKGKDKDVLVSPEKYQIIKEGELQVASRRSVYRPKPKEQEPEKSVFGDIDIGKLAARAAVTIPTWMALRAGISSVMDIIPTAISRFKELDDAVTNMQIFTVGIDNIENFRKKATKALDELSRESGIGPSELSQVSIGLSTLGIDSDASIEAMSYISKSAKALGGDAKLLASAIGGTVQMMGDSISVGSTELEKIIAVTSLLHRAVKSGGGSINDLANALQRASVAAASSGMDISELVANLTVLNSAMIKSGMSGAALTTSLEQLTQKRQLISDYLGGITKEQERNQFTLLMDIIKRIQEFANSGDLKTANEMMSEIFGIRASKNVKALILNIDKFKNVVVEVNKSMELGRADGVESMFASVEEDFKEFSKSLDTQGGRFKNIFGTLAKDFTEGLTGITDTQFAEGIKSANDSLDKFGDGVRGFGEILKDGLIVGGITGITLALTGMGSGLATAALAISSFMMSPAVVAFVALMGAWKVGQWLSKRVTEASGKNLEKFGIAGEEGRQFNEVMKEVAPDLNNKHFADYVAHVGALRRGGETKIPEFEDWLQDIYKESDWFKEWFGKRKTPPVDLDRLVITRPAQELKQLEDEKPSVDLTTPAQRKHDFQVYLLQQEALKRLGVSAITLKERELALLKEVYTDEELISKERQLQLEIIRLQNEEAKKYSDSMQSAIKSSLLGNLQGQGNSLFVDLRDNFTSQIQESLASGLSNILMSTGMGEMFSMIPGFIDEGAKRFTDPIVTGCDLGGKKIFEWIDQAFSKQTGGTASAMGASGVAGVTASYGGTGTGLPGIWGSSIFSKHTMMEPPDEEFIGPMPAKVEPNFWGKLGAYGTLGASSILVATGGMQQMRGGGAKNIMAGLGQMGMGVGSAASGMLGLGFAGGTAAAGTAGMASTLSTLGVAGLAIGVGLMVGSMFMKSKKQTETQTQTSETKVGSKIDVSNKKLEIISRNLIALRNTMETYALATSAYFSERSSTIDQEFALAGRRSY